MLLFHDSVSLPKTHAAWKAGRDDAEINDVLKTELNREAASILDGYNSDDEEADILNLTVEEDRLHAKFAIRFQEVVPSGCSDNPHRKDCRAVFVLQMESDTDQARLGADPSNPDEWDLWDRNSAANGQ